MTVALFLYENIFCRYQAPGECIICDRGEFANKIVETLKKEFKVETRVIAAGRPQSNGQAEIYVKQIKEKMRAIMSENSETLPNNWDESILHHALQCVRSDPSCATGFAPAELLLGRKLVYPIELEKRDIDFSGNVTSLQKWNIWGVKMTKPLVQALQQIHDTTFGKAADNIKKYQEKYAKDYDKKHRKTDSKYLNLRKGMNVQYRKHKSKLPKGKGGLKWFPRDRPLKIHSIDHKKQRVYLRDPKTKTVHKKSHPFERIRRFKTR